MSGRKFWYARAILKPASPDLLRHTKTVGHSTHLGRLHSAAVGMDLDEKAMMASPETLLGFGFSMSRRRALGWTPAM